MTSNIQRAEANLMFYSHSNSRTQRISLRGFALLWVTAVPAVAIAQLDETWTVTAGGQSAQVNPDGTFRIANVSAPDLFGPDGPGTLPDFVSDDVIRVTGTGLINGVRHWVASEPFRMETGVVHAVTTLQVLPYPPPDVAELTLSVDHAVIEPGQQSQVTATAVLNDGSIIDVTPASAWTGYRTSNPSIVRIDENGVVTGIGTGRAFLSAINSGTTAATDLRVVADTVLTVVEGFVLFEDGSPVGGADVTVSFGGESTITDSSGFFSIDASVASATMNLTVVAESLIGGELWSGQADHLAPFADGITDAGIIRMAPPPCAAAWVDRQFCPPGVFATHSIWRVYSTAQWDDGNGEALYVGGLFSVAGCTNVSGIAKWDGTDWSPLGAGIGDGTSTVYAQAIFDDGDGADLYFGGQYGFTDETGGTTVGLARWDGVALGRVGADTAQVTDMLVFDDGSGPALYVAAASIYPDGEAPIGGLARWDGATWEAVGAAFSSSNSGVRALDVFDDGSGPALYIAGTFTSVGGVPAQRVARWTGAGWTAVGAGFSSGTVHALTVFDDGSGPALFAGGFMRLGAAFVSVARWDGAAWSSIVSTPEVRALAAYDDGDGAALFIGGLFSSINGVAMRGAARWHPDDGFSPLGAGLSGAAYTLGTHDLGAGPRLYIGGAFYSADDVAAQCVASWDGSAMASVSPGSGLDLSVDSSAIYDDGSGPALYAGGFFRTAGNILARGVARWDGTAWSPLGSGLNFTGQARTLHVHDDGSGPQLYVGGVLNEAGGLPVQNIARWNGTVWSAVGDGLSPVQDMETFDDGDGPALYAVGPTVYIPPPVNLSMSVVTCWDGNAWTHLPGLFNSSIYNMTVFDDGRGPALYVVGDFDTVDGRTVNGVARWCGSGWEPLGSGLDAGVNVKGWAATVFDDGTGPALYVGGHFTGAGGISANYIARWDGTEWSSLGSGMETTVHALAAFDDGTGDALYAAGNFSLAGGTDVGFIARWDGNAWSTLEAGLTHIDTGAARFVSTLTPYDDGSGPALFVAGGFTHADNGPSTFIAKWQRPQRPCP